VPDKVDGSNLQLAFGVAAIPEDFVELSHILAAAEIAKNSAASGESPVVLYRDLK
jgi:hypothetical protein